ncbi:MAG: LysM peptidoglycan-binding domain-containing protein [Rikenellaceae bacterium]|nr:LysM peptidoglycan-binding domain-containing protein [Rikenellaceae bacterium]MBQ8545231.1 peptidoglycan DD-metalloendopeptidase family protein [Alistipes sp.]
MNLRKTLTLCLALLTAGTLSAQVKTVNNTINKDSLPEDAIIVKRVPLESGESFDPKDVLVVDTIPSSSEGLSIVLYNDNTWRYVRNRAIDVLDETIYTQNWDTTKIHAYDVELKDLPMSMVIDLVDTLKSYHYPVKGRVTSKYGPRRRRIHQGTDIDLETGDPIYATFDGRVRHTTYIARGYGNLIIIRHDNGLETFYAHLSETNVKPGDWVTAGQVIGKGGNTGRSTGSHLHYEIRYKGHTFDPERLIDFTTGTLRRETFLLKRTYFSPYSRFTQDFDEEIQSDEEDKKIAKEAAAIKYHIVKRGDTLGRIAINNHTTVTKLCQLNGIKKTSTLRIGQRIRVR